MGKMLEVLNPETGKVETHTPQNAMDLIQHCGWTQKSVIDVRDAYIGNAQEVLDKLTSGAAAKSDADKLAAAKSYEAKSEAAKPAAAKTATVEVAASEDADELDPEGDESDGDDD